MLVSHSVAWNDSHCSPDELVISQPAVPWILPLRPQTVQLWACRLRLGCFNQKIKHLWVFVCIQTSSQESSFAWFTIQNNPSLCHTEQWPSFSLHPAWNKLLLTPAFLRLALPQGGYAPPQWHHKYPRLEKTDKLSGRSSRDHWTYTKLIFTN